MPYGYGRAKQRHSGGNSSKGTKDFRKVKVSGKRAPGKTKDYPRSAEAKASDERNKRKAQIRCAEYSDSKEQLRETLEMLGIER